MNNPNNHWRGVKSCIYFPIFVKYEPLQKNGSEAAFSKRGHRE